MPEEFIKVGGKQIQFQFRQLGTFDGVGRRVDDATRKGIQESLRVLRDSIRQSFEERRFSSSAYRSVNDRPDGHPSAGQPKFVTNIKYQTRVQGHNITGQVFIGGSKSWLTDILRFGAQPHPIYAVNAPELSFWWFNRPGGEGVFKGEGLRNGHPGVYAGSDFVAEGARRVMNAVQNILVNGVKNEFQ